MAFRRAVPPARSSETLITNPLHQILGDEQAGLTHLTKILQKDLRDIGVIYGEEMAEEGPPLDLLTMGGALVR